LALLSTKNRHSLGLRLINAGLIWLLCFPVVTAC